MSSPLPDPDLVGVLVVEDQSVFGDMLARYIAAQPGFRVQARVHSVADAQVALVGHPHVVVFDWMLPDGTGVELLRAITQCGSRSRALIFSANVSETAIRQALTGGATGYLEKDATSADLTDALRAVAAGHTYLGPRAATVMRQAVRRGPAETRELTAREREILRLVGEGCASKQIAGLLGLSVRTVENHRAAIMRKTGLHSAAQLAVHAVKLGLVTVGAPSASLPV